MLDKELLEKMAAANFDGVFSAEKNPQYEGQNTKGHIIRYSPNNPPPRPDGSQTVKMSFPVLAASAWLDSEEEVLAVFAEFLTYGPMMAAEILKGRADD